MARLTDYHAIIMANIITGEVVTGLSITQAARLAGISTRQVKVYIETGRQNRKGWTFDEEETNVCKGN